MRAMLAIVGSIGLTAVCWGLYGPVLHKGQSAMDGSRLRPFICVGLAYFVIAVLVPAAMLLKRGERGSWTRKGTIYSLAAGAAGALGALGIILAFNFGGEAIFVMPLVFGCAPVVNAFVAIVLARSYKEVGPLFLAGLILVVAGAVSVMIFKPHSQAAAEGIVKAVSTGAMVIVFVAITALCWGLYGPILHKGQATMSGSRLRPLICVGLAYFLIAVIIPFFLLPIEQIGGWTWTGTTWSLAAGAAGAFGALGIILAFNFGGKPMYVMPLVFGGAPVVNTIFSILRIPGKVEISPLFYVGLVLVALGAVTVLAFAPKSHAAPSKPKPKPQKPPAPTEAEAPVSQSL